MFENSYMKKLFILLILTIILFLSIYLLIPPKINFAKLAYIHTNINVANRFITDESKWQKWWPVAMQGGLTHSVDNEIHSYKNYSYIIKRKMYEGMSILIEHDSNMVNSFLQIIALNKDSIAVQWKGVMPATYNPFKKISNYILATKVKKNISEVLQTAKMFLENKENVYGLHIVQEKVKDTLLISTKYFSKTPPSTEDIYKLIKNLKEYISIQGSSETNYPMLNIMQDGSEFKTMVAIPINKNIAENQTFIIKKMVPGKILVAEIKGGQNTVAEAINNVNIYMEDNHLVAPAISFESLISDRVKEKDSTKWVTKIYFPIY